MMLNNLQFMLQHPMSQGTMAAPFRRFIAWQFRCRVQGGDITVPWVNDARLVARRGMEGATGNIYYGLHEFSEMGFLLHFLRPEDLFCDIGANVGSYTILASRVVGARTCAFEPDPQAMRDLTRNIAVNEIAGRVTSHGVALGAASGTVAFTRGKGTCNRVAKPEDTETQDVSVRRLDDVLSGQCPSLIKIDVEGYEEQVFLGAGKTIENPELKAVSTETFNPDIEFLLTSAGFQKMFYDPRSRRLSPSPPGFIVSNTLLVRDIPNVEERLRTAPAIRIFGKRL